MRALLLLLLIPSAFANEPQPGMSGWEAFSELQNGNMRFYEGRSQHQHQSIARREELSTGQKPHTIILSCSDSRVGPEVIFDQGLGDLFVIRVAGNVVGADAIASIEYAIEHLGSRLLLVMGHESCGAVKAAIGSKAGVTNGSESLDILVEHIRGNLSAPGVASAASDATARQPVKENVSATLKELLKKSAIVAGAVQKKSLILAQGIYSLKTGRVEFWDVGGAKVATAPAEEHAAPAHSHVPATASAPGHRHAQAHAPAHAHAAKPKWKNPIPVSLPMDAPKILEQSVSEEIIPAQAPKKTKHKATAH